MKIIYGGHRPGLFGLNAFGEDFGKMAPSTLTQVRFEIYLINYLYLNERHLDTSLKTICLIIYLRMSVAQFIANETISR